MKETLLTPSRMNGSLRFEFQTYPMGDLRPKRYKVVLILDGTDLDETSVTVRMDWLATAVAEALRAFGLAGGGYKVVPSDYYNAAAAARRAEDFTLPLFQQAVFRTEG